MIITIIIFPQHVFHFLGILLSLLCFYIFNIIFNFACVTCNPPANPYGVAFHAYSDPVHWLTVLLAVIISLAPR